MNGLPAGTRVWLAAGFTDMRSGFNGLAANIMDTGLCRVRKATCKAMRKHGSSNLPGHAVWHSYNCFSNCPIGRVRRPGLASAQQEDTMQRSLWKGAISFGLVHIPVQMFSAEDRRHELDLTMLDKRDFAPIGYKRVNKDTGREVDWDDIVKGYEYEKDQFVVLSPEDLRRANVEASQTIDIMTFVNRDEVPVVYFEQPYYLTPDKGGEKVYALLREALNRSGMVGIAQVVIRARQHLVALLPMGDMVVMNTLRYHDELKAIDDFELPRSNSRKLALQDKEVEMALALVKGMAGDFEPEQFHDTYREDVMTVVQRKIKAKQTRLITEPEPEEDKPAKESNIVDLMALLRESMERRGARAPAAKAAKSAKTPARKAAHEPAKKKRASA